MKFFLTVLSIVLFNAFGVLANQDSIPAFRGIEWGVSLDSVYRNGEKIEFQHFASLDYNNAYTLPGDALNLGNVNLNEIVYVFNKENRFFKVVMEGVKKDIDEVLFILEHKFGEPKNVKNYDGGSYHQWLIREVTVTLLEHQYHTYELIIESDWQAAEAYYKNTHVDDF